MSHHVLYLLDLPQPESEQMSTFVSDDRLQFAGDFLGCFFYRAFGNLTVEKVARSKGYFDEGSGQQGDEQHT